MKRDDNAPEGSTYIVTKRNPYFPIDTILTLVLNDKSIMPRFSGVTDTGNETELWVQWDSIEPYSSRPSEAVGNVKVGDTLWFVESDSCKGLPKGKCLIVQLDGDGVPVVIELSGWVKGNKPAYAALERAYFTEEEMIEAMEPEFTPPTERTRLTTEHLEHGLHNDDDYVICIANQGNNIFMNDLINGTVVNVHDFYKGDSFTNLDCTVEVINQGYGAGHRISQIGLIIHDPEEAQYDYGLTIEPAK